MIIYDYQDEIGIITLNRPEKRNALHPELVRQLKTKLSEIREDNSVKILIITGAGTTFCAGADLEYLNDLKDYSLLQNEKDSRDLAELFLMTYEFPKPVVAAVNGAAIAGGCGLASVCDIIVADETNSKFGYSEVRIGFIPAIVSTFLIRKIGEGMARQLLLSGELISGKRAYEIGLVNYLENNALSGAINISSMWIKNSQLSLKMTKEMIANVANLSVQDAVEYCIALNTISRTTKDFQNGLNTFLLKK